MKKNPYPGKFIVFDGLDGSGISTQAAKLVDFLKKKKQKLQFGYTGVYLTKEPTLSLIGGIIKGQLTHDWKSSPECLQLLFSADRAYHLEKEIIPLLEKGAIVVSDRYLFSTIAFGSLDIEDRDWLLNLNKNFLIPDLTFLLRVSPKICIKRLGKTRYKMTIFEQKEKLEKAWENFEKLPKEFENVYIINGERLVNKVAQDIQKIVKEKLL